MAPIAKLFVQIGADITGFKKGLNEVDKGIEKTSSKFSNLGKSMINGVKYAALGTTAALAGLGAWVGKTGIEFNAFQQQAETAFTTMLGSGEKAKSFMKELNDFAKKTPFEITGLTETSQKLLAFGFDSKSILPTLTSIGDAVAGLGGSPELLNRITVALGQIKAKGKVQAEEMLQLTEAGIPAWEMLANKIGVTIPEAMQMVTKGMIDSETAIGALTEGMDQKFGGLMEKQSKSWNGMLSTFKDYFAQISGRVMAPFFDLANKGLAKILSMMESPQFEKFINDFVTFVEVSTPKVISLIETIWNYGKSFADWIGSLNILSPKNEIVGSLGEIGQELVKLVGNLQKLFPNWDSNLGSFLKVTTTIFGNILGVVVDTVGLMLKNLNSLITVIVAVKEGNWKGAWEGLKEIASNNLNFIEKEVDRFGSKNWREKLTSGLVTAKDEWLKTWDFIKEPLRGFGEFILRSLSPIGDMLAKALTQPMKDALNQIVDWHNGMIRTFNNTLGFGGVSIPELPHFANGGVMQKSGLAVVGERGPEVVAMSRGSRVIPNNQIGDTYITINVDANARIDRSLVDMLARELQKKLNQQGNRVAFT